MKQPAVIASRKQAIRAIDELPGENVVFGYSDHREFAEIPIFVGVCPHWRGPAIALGRGRTIDEAIDNMIHKRDAWRRVRRLGRSPIEWGV